MKSSEWEKKSDFWFETRFKGTNKVTAILRPQDVSIFEKIFLREIAKAAINALDRSVSVKLDLDLQA